MKVINVRSHDLFFCFLMLFIYQLCYGAPPSSPPPPPPIPELTLTDIAVTPINPSINIGDVQAFTATGNYSDTTSIELGPYATEIAVGDNHSCALLVSGQVQCWGDNSYSQLGDGTNTGSAIPVTVIGTSTATAIAVGADYSCALLASGQVQCWGANYSGQLGDGTTTSSGIPVTVSGISTATAIAMGGMHSCALLADHTVHCWGSNFYSLAYSGSIPFDITPESTGITTASAIAAGLNHTCALLASSQVQCWGNNFSGQLGNGTETSSDTPVTVSGINTATAIAMGASHSCALLTGGTMQCWGSYPFGTNTDSLIPVTVDGVSTATAIAAGNNNNLALLADGTVTFWGWHFQAPVGSYITSPVAVDGEFTSSVTAISMWDNNCALLTGGTVRCWHGINNVSNAGIVKGIGVVWSSSDTAVATVDVNGMVHGLSDGTTIITATVEGVSASVGLSVGSASTSVYTVGGTITGLAGTIVLQNNGGDELSRSVSDAFTFTTSITHGSTYNVRVLMQPIGQTCVVTNGSGTINGANITNVEVTCTNISYTIGGDVTGLPEDITGPVLQNNGGENIATGTNRDFTFTTKQLFNTSYNVSVSQQPDGYLCTVANATGTIGSANVTNVNVTCTIAASDARGDSSESRSGGGSFGPTELFMIACIGFGVVGLRRKTGPVYLGPSDEM